MTHSKLLNLRADLAQMTEEIFKLYSQRQGLINSIQDLKKSEQLNAWDPKRELDIFRKMNFDGQMGMATSYSLLLETQVRNAVEYPQWSLGEHLSERSGTLRDFINPILLFTLNKQEYCELKLKPKFKSIIDEVLKYEKNQSHCN